jgi:hypothetical protein
MNSLYQRMGDRNATFINGFHGEGFHSHLCELACFAYLEEARFHIERPDPSPDFLATTPRGNAIAVEATTANPTPGRMTDISLRALSELSPGDILAKVEREFPKRMRSILMRKLLRRYQERPHCEGLPLVLAVAPSLKPAPRPMWISLFSIFSMGATKLPTAAVAFSTIRTERKSAESFTQTPLPSHVL